MSQNPHDLLRHRRALYLAGQTTDATARMDLSIIARALGISAGTRSAWIDGQLAEWRTAKTAPPKN
jgi:hypothetical protein